MSKAPLRVGRIAYTNVAPVETAFDAGAVVRPALATSAPPATLNAMLSAGELDASPISAAHYLRNTDTLELLGDVCIAARGEVISVLLVSAKPPALLDGVRIAVTRESASGRALLEALLTRRYGVTATFEPLDDALAVAASGRPTLLLGDAAIAVRSLVPPASVHDLGQAWFEWTGLPMVFAVWAVRRDIAAARPDDVAALRQAYADARAWGAEHRDAVLDAAIAQRPQSRAFYERYYRTLTYVLDDEARAGLERFGTEIVPAEVCRVAR